MGAKIAWITIGSKDIKQLKVVINLNCPLDILLDYARRDLLKKIEMEIITLKDGHLQEPNIDSTKQQTQNEEDLSPLLNKLIETQEILFNNTDTFDLCDSTGGYVNCQENIKKLADTVLTQGAIYVLGKRSTDEKGNLSCTPFTFSNQGQKKK